MSTEKETELKQRVFTVQEVAQMCGHVHPSTIYRAVEAGQLLPLKGFEVLRFPILSLSASFVTQERKPKREQNASGRKNHQESGRKIASGCSPRGNNGDKARLLQHLFVSFSASSHDNIWGAQAAAGQTMPGYQDRLKNGIARLPGNSKMLEPGRPPKIKYADSVLDPVNTLAGTTSKNVTGKGQHSATKSSKSEATSNLADRILAQA